MIYDIIHATYIPEKDIASSPCTANGIHNVTGIDLKGQTDACSNPTGFVRVEARCSEEGQEILHFIRECDDDRKQGKKESKTSGETRRTNYKRLSLLFSLF